MSTAQHSVQPTSGTLRVRDFRQFTTPQQDSVFEPALHPAPAPQPARLVRDPAKSTRGFPIREDHPRGRCRKPLGGRHSIGEV